MTDDRVARLVELFRSATGTELSAGLSWYQDSHERIRAIAREFGADVRTVAGVVAALSPRTDWPQNLNKARQVLATGDTYGLSNGIVKAQKIMAGEDPDDVLSGPKTLAFFANLVDPAGTDAVTIDAHAVDAAHGLTLGDAGRKRILERKGGYEAVADLYRQAGRILGVAPHVVQAVVWTVWRNRFGHYRYQRTEELT